MMTEAINQPAGAAPSDDIFVTFNGKAFKLTPVEVQEAREGADVEKCWTEFWKPLVTNEAGKLDVEQVKRELADLSMLLSWVPRVYCHVTGHRISMVNTWPSVVCSVADEIANDLVDDAVREAQDDAAAPAANAQPGDTYLVPAALLDAFPELNVWGYDDEDVRDLNKWGIDLVQAARAANAQPGEPPEVLAKIAKAEQTVADLCHGRIKWTMRVPAEPDRDPDLIIAGALQAARDALAHAQSDSPSPAVKDVLAERKRQVTVEGWTSEHDDGHDPGELAGAASAYALYADDELYPQSRGDGNFSVQPPMMWPFENAWWKPENPRRALVKAGALILAEIERIDRAHPSRDQEGM